MRTPLEAAEDLMVGSEVTRPVTDLFQYLKEDHRRVDELLTKASETSEDMTEMRAELWTGIRDGLTLHAELEEAVLYPRLEKVNDTHDLTLESYEEHNVVKHMLDEIDAVPCDSEEWMAKLTVLKENVEHHVKEEETGLFPRSKDNLSDEEKKGMADQAEEFLTTREAD